MTPRIIVKRVRTYRRRPGLRLAMAAAAGLTAALTTWALLQAIGWDDRRCGLHSYDPAHDAQCTELRP